MASFVKVGRERRKKRSKSPTNENYNIRLADSMSELIMSTFYLNCIDSLHCVLEKITNRTNFKENGLSKIDLVCYGLGNFMDSYIARYQLALLQALRIEFQKEIADCEVYDPIFTVEEKNFLQKHNMDVQDVNKEGKHQCNIDRITVFYMPHCGKALYNNILWRNWLPDYLQQVVIIGNSFSSMIERTPNRILSKTAGYVIKIHPYTSETELDCASDFDNIFNDTSIHMFNVQEVPKELWEDVKEPVYETEDAEIIFAPRQHVENS